jgi:transcriptional regulator GlxA family with amidase domain
VAQRRAGGQTQFSPLLLSEPESSNIRSVLNYIHTHLDADLSVTRLAEIACLSPRQFSRKFTAETGEIVARVVERIRVDAAKGMLENGVGNVEKVARLCGFGSTGRMRRAFLKYWDKSSQAFK